MAADSFLLNCILMLSFLSPTVCHTCIHHKVSHEDIPEARALPKDRRIKRHLLTSPLHIHVHMDDIQRSVHENVRHRVDAALKEAVEFFRETLEVKQNLSPFLLERLNCDRKWQHGINKNKCSRLKSGPEFCSTKLTDYIIPDAYLSKVEVYNYTDNIPHQVLNEGQGIKGANFILFVISRTTSWCTENDVQAYGSYCRLDNENRPVAGLLNLCPSKFSNELFSDSHYFNVIMHELIHILGFSHHLYPKFKTCHSAHDCEVPKKIVHTDVHNVQRLVFPELIKSMQSHFNCSESEFGAPLEPQKGKGSSLNENQYTSHWHPLLMYTSIMTPSLLEDSYVAIDNITLALLYSTGWYKVNFEMAQKFQFGKGTGCNFGFEDNCENYNHHRLSSNNASNCDILEYSIGKCETIVPYHPCAVHKDQGDNFDDTKKNSVLDVHLVDYEHTCASIQDGNNRTDPLCLVTKCRNTQNVTLLENSSLATCSSGKVQDKTLNCSNNFPTCSSRKCSCKYDSGLAIFMQMYRRNPPTFSPIPHSNFTTIETYAAQEIINSMTYIRNISLDGREHLNVCMPSHPNTADFDGIIEKTRGFLQCSYMQIYEESLEGTEILLTPDVAVPSNVHGGSGISFILLAVCGIIVVAVLIPLILRFASRRRQTTESVNLKDINQSAI